MKRKNHLLKSHETLLDFAFRKKVYAQSVYNAIAKGKIIPDVVGTSKVLMIDLRKYGSYRFQVRNADKTALVKWFLSAGIAVKGKRANRKILIILKSQKQ